jgi:NAD(P)-dependent dehydrogenase (short-subunit alcohol dehydrogenase family)
MEEPMGKLDGKVAIVTGGVRGLGRAYARHLAKGSRRNNCSRSSILAKIQISRSAAAADAHC